jgi:hypothetical protein
MVIDRKELPSMESDPHRLSVRLNFTQREIAVEGSPAKVAEWFDRFQPFVDAFAMAPQASSLRPADPLNGEAAPSVGGGSASATAEIPFGEYLHRFRDEITDVDRVLIAGHYIQLNSSERAFETGQANQLLKDQGIKVGNASECVRRNLMAKRIFALTKGNFRLSTDGFNYLKELQR